MDIGPESSEFHVGKWPSQLSCLHDIQTCFRFPSSISVRVRAGIKCCNPRRSSGKKSEFYTAFEIIGLGDLTFADITLGSQISWPQREKKFIGGGQRCSLPTINGKFECRFCVENKLEATWYIGAAATEETREILKVSTDTSMSPPTTKISLPGGPRGNPLSLNCNNSLGDMHLPSALAQLEKLGFHIEVKKMREATQRPANQKPSTFVR